jgi:preprotein translocase subunit SecD
VSINAVACFKSGVSNPWVKPAGSGLVSGNGTVEQANQLAVLLRAGALPAKLTVVEERVVPRSSGVDDVDVTAQYRTK